MCTRLTVSNGKQARLPSNVDKNHELTLKYVSSSKEMNELHGHVWMNFTNVTSAERS